MRYVCGLMIFICFFAHAYNHITVLTKPLGWHKCDAHQGALRSLLNGLRLCNAPFNVNPTSVDEIGDIVHVMAGAVDSFDTLRMLKESGQVKKIIVGPNVGDFCRAGSAYVQAPYIDGIISLADWVLSGFLQAYPDLNQDKVKQWFHGVDVDYWMPSMQEKKERYVLVYNKEQPALANSVEQILRDNGWTPLRITYGQYHAAQFKQALEQAHFAVFLSYSESHGIALSEAWSMDVPTIVWNDKGPHAYLGITYAYSSACPFLTPATGIDWQTLDQFKEQLAHIDTLLASCTPRQWVLENMSDERSVQALLRIIEAL